MSRRMLIVAVVVVVLLATAVTPAAANPLEVGDAAIAPAEVGHGLSGALIFNPLSMQLAGGGCGGGSGNCPT
jgi:hypothetical protein